MDYMILVIKKYIIFGNKLFYYRKLKFNYINWCYIFKLRKKKVNQYYKLMIFFYFVLKLKINFYKKNIIIKKFFGIFLMFLQRRIFIK